MEFRIRNCEIVYQRFVLNSPPGRHHMHKTSIFMKLPVGRRFEGKNWFYGFFFLYQGKSWHFYQIVDVEFVRQFKFDSFKKTNQFRYIL